MKHFSDNVTAELATKLKDIAELVKEDFICEQNSECYGDGRIEEISGKSYSGFIARQDGGFEVSSLYRSDIDSSYHLTKAQTACMDDVYDNFHADFKADHKELNLADDYSYDDIPEELQNEFADAECNYFEPALLRMEMWIDRDAEQSVFMRLSLNYRDQPYYRAKYDESLFEIKVKSADVLRKDAEFFLKLFNRKMKKVV